MQQSKHIFKPFKNRNSAIGKERRRNGAKVTLENQPHFPKSVVYRDIDQAVFDWVDKELPLSYDGERLPTYKLFSNQRISEYGQNWKETDEKGNIQTNFKTVTRENNPQHGESQGNSFNVPGNREYPIFRTKVLDENGDEIIQVYSMKQPFAVNMIYTISIVTTSYNMLNEMNNNMLNEFKSLERYIFPNGYAMPMLLNSISDESDYIIDDRKYYAQTYQIKVMAFIINDKDFKVKKIPSRVKTTFSAGVNSKNRESKEKYNIDAIKTDEFNLATYKAEEKCNGEYKVNNEAIEHDFDEIYNPISGHSEIEVTEYDGKQICYADTEYEMYVNRKVIYEMKLDICDTHYEFIMDCDLNLETIGLSNVNSYKLYINDDLISIEDSDVIFNDGDKVKIEYELKNKAKLGELKLICFDSETIE